MLQDKTIHTPSYFIWWHAPDFRSIVIQLRVITRQWVGFTLKALLILLVHCLYQMKNTRLRLCCSSLNYDLFRKTIPDSSLCTCNQVETAAHFLLYCPLYNRQRQLFSRPSMSTNNKQYYFWWWKPELCPKQPCVPKCPKLYYFYKRFDT